MTDRRELENIIRDTVASARYGNGGSNPVVTATRQIMAIVDGYVAQQILERIDVEKK